MKKLELIFANRYQTRHCISYSQKSQVYLSRDKSIDQEVIIKLQSILPDQKQPSMLQKEAKIFRAVKGGIGIPTLYWYGVQHNYRVLVTNVYGPSLEQLLKYCSGRFTLKTALMIAQQLIDRIEWLHSKQFIYNNMNTDNFFIGLGPKADKIFMLGYGFCQKYVDLQTNHLALSKTSQIIPSYRFVSIHTHISKKTSRRDDLQSLGYMLIYMLKGGLPWDEIKNEDKNIENYEIKEKKTSIPIKILCQGLPKQFQEYFNYVKQLQFQQQPDYCWLKRIFLDLFYNLGYDNNQVMDWAEKYKD